MNNRVLCGLSILIVIFLFAQVSLSFEIFGVDVNIPEISILPKVLKKVLKTLPEERGRAILARKANKTIESRIFFGTPAVDGQFPFYGFGIIFENRMVHTYCGGSLITLQFVLSTAHCVAGPIVFAAQFFFGSANLNDFMEYRDGIAYACHPNFDNPPYNYDISVIQLSYPLCETDKIRPIALPRRISNLFSYEGIKMTIAGFGSTENTFPALPVQMTYTTLIGMSTAECSVETGLPPSLGIFCARNASSSICFGDSGGALIYQNTIVGISSFVTTPNCFNGTGGFTRVDRYLDWIAGFTGQQIEWI